MPKTLLLADDSVTIQKVVGISFANEDVELLTVDNGDDAIARAREARPDIVLADVVMPGKSGYEVCEAIKTDPQLRHVPVLLLTGTFEAFDEARAREAGADGHITKPFEAQALVSQVNELLSRAAAAPAAAPAGDAAPELAASDPTPAAAASADDAYDFFDDDLNRDLGVSASEGLPTAGSSGLDLTPPPSGPAESDLDDFAIGADDGIDLDSAPELDVAPAAAAPDATVALMPEEPGDLDLAGRSRAAAGTAAPDPAATVLADFDEAPAASVEHEPAPPAPAAPPPPAAPDPAETVIADDLFGPPSGAPDELSAALPPTDDDLDFAFDDAPTNPPGDAARALYAAVPPEETVLDPNGASGYDVSSSDLRDPLGRSGAADLTPGFPAPEFGLEEPTDVALEMQTAAPSPPAAPAPMPETTPPAPASDGLATEFMPVDGPAPPPIPTQPPPIPASPPPLPSAAPERSAAPEPWAAPEPEPEWPAAETPRPEPDEMPAVEATPAGPVDVPFAPEIPMAAIDDGMPGAVDPDSETAPAPRTPELSPVMRDRVHEVLERVAWEAFSDVSEQIVSQVLERVEKIAWEVVPQMAEALVREEIRRMKGEDEG